MNILMISTDKKVFDENSAVRQRLFDYGTLVKRLVVIVLNKNTQAFRNTKIGANVYLCPVNSPSKFLYFFDAIKIASKLKNIDLITAQDPYETGFIAWRIAKKLKIKLELQIHTDVFSFHFMGHSWMNKIRSLIARFLLPKADGIRVVSKRIKSSLSKKLQEKTIILPIFTGIERIQKTRVGLNLRKQYPQFKFIILMMSRLEKEKNIPLAVLALKKVVKVFPKTGLIIVGSGSLRKTLRRQARRLGLEENIIFKQWTDNPIAYYKTADLFLSTSNYEGYGLSLTEAILSHCPILTAKVGIVGEVLSSNNSLLCESRDENCFAQNIIKAQQYPELLKDFEQKAYSDFVQKAFQSKAEYLNAFQKSWLEIVNKK